MQDRTRSRSIEPPADAVAVGQPVRRKEDDALVRGAGRYTDDINFPGQAYLAMVRSPHAHGELRAIDVEPARAMPGVLGVFTAADLAGYGTVACALPLRNRDGTPLRSTRRAALAAERVRFVGDPVAFVVATTAAQARDAAETVAPDIEPLPAITRPEHAGQSGAPQLYEDIAGNCVLDYHFGDDARVADAFAAAAHVVALDMLNTRLVVAAMEPRCGVGSYDATSGRYTLHLPTQGVAGARNALAALLATTPDKVRVLTGHVGGSFGMKHAIFPEYLCLLHAAKVLGRPVKWTDVRSTSFLSDTHGRASLMRGELALAADGTFLALRMTGFGDMGAYVTPIAPLPSTVNTVKNAASVYRTPLIELATRCVVTTTTPVAAYRGAGRPEGNYFMERLIDAAARETGLDRAALRRRNLVKPSQMPYAAASKSVYDSGNFPAVFERALELADYAGFAKRKRDSRRRGRLRGIAIGNYLEVTAPPNKELAKIRFETDGTVSLVTGTLDYGQGHATPFAQVLAAKLGVPFSRIRLIQSDSDDVRIGGGSGGSRSLTASGTAIVEAAALVIARGTRLAGHLLETADADIEFSRGRFTVAGTDRGIGIMEIAARLHQGESLPDGVPHSLDVDHDGSGAPSTYPNGCHVVEVEVDPDTGMTEVVRYHGVNDFGTIVNPMIVEGQLHGGIAQGLGQALMEVARYDDDGQLVTGSFMDYALPRAADMPFVALENLPSPATTNPLGTKGCGEAGCAGSLSAVVNATLDALAEFGVRHIDLPLTPEKVWRAIHAARAARAG
ncbi:MAG: xanthine dehydrogenase family protein molybdopterin-binding subunit [Xanthobacteraceae bacterium]|nr:MAG: xanthine dehydrogenase family protein molybdopterin-binding subunit [Xanthobacteraceae bacterium]